MDELLSLLSTETYVTGEQLCRELGITRAAIWKRMEKLRQEGYAIVAAGKRGYRLEPKADCLLPGYIRQGLPTAWAGKGSLFYQRHMGSTNTLLKEQANQGAPKGSLAVCELQTEGRGRRGRGWEAAEGESLTQSLLLCPKLPTEQAQLCTLAAAVGMARAIEEVAPGLEAGIKWPNDVLVNGKKCVGILSELAADMDGIRFIVMGVGVNVNQRQFPGELQGRATSLWLEASQGREALPPIDRCLLLQAYLAHMEAALEALEKEGLPGILPEYADRSLTFGAQVRVLGSDTDFVGTAEGLDETGALLVTDQQGLERRVLSGDVSVRGVMGYV